MNKLIDSNKKLENFLSNEFQSIRQSGNINEKTSKFFNEIGSTQTEDIFYKDQIDIKTKAIKNIFQELIPQNILESFNFIESPKQSEYRFKMDFICSFNPMHEPNSRFGQRKKGNFSWVVDLDEFELIDKNWFKKIRAIYDASQKLGFKNYDLKTAKGELRYIVSKVYKNESMLIILTRTSENETKMDKLAYLAQKLGFKSVYWQQQPALSDVSFGSTIKYWGAQYITIPIKIKSNEYFFRVGPDSFFQNNIFAFEKAMEYIESVIKTYQFTDFNLLDLYSGVGSIGIILAKHFKSLVGVDIVEQSIKLANENLKLNSIKNASYFTLDMNNSFDGISRKIDLTNDFVAIVDPPRTGLENHGVQELLTIRPKYVFYISCNPITQAKDLAGLQELYKPVLIKGFDFFPHTYHMENFILLERLS